MLSSCLGLRTSACGVYAGAGVTGGEDGSCQRVARATWKNSLLPSLDGEQHPRFRRRLREKSSDAAKRYSEQQRMSNYNAAHFYSLLNCAGGRMGRWEWGQTSKIIPQCDFWFSLFCNSNSLCLGQQYSHFLSGSLSVFIVVVDVNSCHTVCNDLMRLWIFFCIGEKQNLKYLLPTSKAALFKWSCRNKL